MRSVWVGLGQIFLTSSHIHEGPLQHSPSILFLWEICCKQSIKFSFDFCWKTDWTKGISLQTKNYGYAKLQLCHLPWRCFRKGYTSFPMEYLCLGMIIWNLLKIKLGKPFFMGIIIFMVWSMWTSRNNLIFDNEGHLQCKDAEVFWRKNFNWLSIERKSTSQLRYLVSCNSFGFLLFFFLCPLCTYNFVF
jgi:hypothetical protein